ncbi:hypothetical protein AVEN_35406-1 [Araneus ventricosus]|uniref:Uncharacterized protein n=1 Tax=Araneus ventricosus TaxID=182803 RepID=A0A4Y2N7Y1_ARAVE|nr:hypothetical protein AVEN_35406-1 [Araneus ventricosus]
MKRFRTAVKSIGTFIPRLIKITIFKTEPFEFTLGHDSVLLQECSQLADGKVSTRGLEGCLGSNTIPPRTFVWGLVHVKSVGHMSSRWCVCWRGMPALGVFLVI